MSYIISGNLSVTNGQFGKVINTTIATNSTLWSFGIAQIYILDSNTASVDLTLPPISDTGANIGHSILIQNVGAFNIVIKNSIAGTVTSAVFTGTIVTNGTIMLIAGNGGANDWLVPFYSLNNISLQTAYDNSTNPATVEYTDSKPIELQSSSSNYLDFKCVDDNSNNIFRVASSAANTGAVTMFGATAPDNSNSLCAGSGSSISAPNINSFVTGTNNTIGTSDAYVIGQSNTTSGTGGDVYICGQSNTITNSSDVYILGKSHNITSGTDLYLIGRQVASTVAKSNIIAMSTLTTPTFTALNIDNATNESIIIASPEYLEIVNGSTMIGTSDHSNSLKIIQKKTTTNNSFSNMLSRTLVINSLISIQCSVIGIQVTGTNIGANFIYKGTMYFRNVNGVAASTTVTSYTFIPFGLSWSVSPVTSGGTAIVRVSSSGNATGTIRWYGNFNVQEVRYA